MQGWCPVKKNNLFPSTFLQCVQSANPLVISLISSISLCCDIRLLWPLKEGNNNNPLYEPGHWEIDPDCCGHFDRVMLLLLTRCYRKVNLWLSHQRISTLSFLRRQSKLNYYFGKWKKYSIVHNIWSWVVFCLYVHHKNSSKKLFFGVFLRLSFDGFFIFFILLQPLSKTSFTFSQGSLILMA